jgi:Na+-transporting NADH:ubiquinone oxidoreductase subunit NqrD
VVEVVARRDGYTVELVDVVGEGFGYAVEMAVVEVVDEGFGYAVEMAVVEVVDQGFGYAVDLQALASGECSGCIASL